MSFVPAVFVAASGSWTAGLAGALAVIATLLVGGLLWLGGRQRRTRAELAGERARHGVTRAQVTRLEYLDLAAQRLSGADTHIAIVDHAAEAARLLVGATHTVLVLTAADDLVVAVPGAVTSLTSDGEQLAHELAGQVRARRATVRNDNSNDAVAEDGSTAQARPQIGTPLRDREAMVGVLVLVRPPGAAPFSVPDAMLVERLAGHVARAVVRSHGEGVRRGAGPLPPVGAGPEVVVDLAVPGSDAAQVAGGLPLGASDDERPPARTSPHIAAPRGTSPYVMAPWVVSDLVPVVRGMAVHARELAEAQGQRRRVAVLAPVSAPVQHPATTLQPLVRSAYELVLAATEPGTNISVEVLALEGRWELVIAHDGEAIGSELLRAGDLSALVGELGGELESGQGAGVARIRIRIPGALPADQRDAPSRPVPTG